MTSLQWLPTAVSTYGPDIDGIIWFITITFGGLFLVAEALLVWFVIRYRQRPDVGATYETGTTPRALAWILIPALIVLVIDIGIDVLQTPVWDHIKIALPPNPDVEVRIIGRQFSWEFVYPGADRTFGTGDDHHVFNQLRVPVGASVRFQLEAADVLHSLWIPHLRLKQDAVPGRSIAGWFEATTEGIYPILCAELCGVGHGIMKGELHVLSAATFESWLQTVAIPPTPQGASS